MALPKRLIRGEKGRGVNVYEDQLNLISSEGAALEGANGAWHLELSETKHVYLTRRGPDLRLMFKEFTRESGSLRPSGHWVEMDKQQLVDFIFVSPDTIFTCRRNDITTLYEREVLCASGATLTGMVRDYNPAELRRLTSFPEIPDKVVDVHIGKLLFVHAKSRFRSLELKQYRVDTQEENNAAEKSAEQSKAETPLKNAKGTRWFNMLREDIYNFYKGLPSLLERWGGLKEMMCCTQMHREAVSGDFLDDVMRECVHCCPLGSIVRKLPVQTSKSRYWMDTDVFSVIPVQETANSRWLAQVGLGAIWGYKVAHIAKMLSPARRPLLESIAVCCTKLVDADVRLLVNEGKAVYKDAISQIQPTVQVTSAVLPPADQAVSVPNTNEEQGEVDDSSSEDGEEEEEEAEDDEGISDTEGYEEEGCESNVGMSINQGFENCDSPTSDLVLQSVADQLEKAGYGNQVNGESLTTQQIPHVVDRSTAERAVEAVMDLPQQNRASKPRSSFNLLKSILSTSDAANQLPAAATLPESVAWQPHQQSSILKQSTKTAQEMKHAQPQPNQHPQQSQHMFEAKQQKQQKHQAGEHAQQVVQQPQHIENFQERSKQQPRQQTQQQPRQQPQQQPHPPQQPHNQPLKKANQQPQQHTQQPQQPQQRPEQRQQRQQQPNQHPRQQGQQVEQQKNVHEGDSYVDGSHHQDYVTPKTHYIETGGPPILKKIRAVKRLRFENEPPPILSSKYDLVSDFGEDEEDGVFATSTPKKKKRTQNKGGPTKRSKPAAKKHHNPANVQSSVMPQASAAKNAAPKCKPLRPIIIN